MEVRVGVKCCSSGRHVGATSTGITSQKDAANKVATAIAAGGRQRFAIFTGVSFTRIVA